MSNVVQFTGREAPLRVQIVASRVADSFRYLVIVDDRSTLNPLDADSLADARGMAAFFSDSVIEMGPPAAFGREP
jgi:hypothetical protein